MKGEKEIRIVHDGSKSVLNLSLYAPWFALQTIYNFAWWVIVVNWCTYNDYGDMFLNLHLHPYVQKFCDVNLT